MGELRYEIHDVNLKGAIGQEGTKSICTLTAMVNMGHSW